MSASNGIVKPVDVTHVIPYMHRAAGGPPIVVDRISCRLASEGWSNRVVTTDTLARGLPQDWIDQYGSQYDMIVFPSRGPSNFGFSRSLAAQMDQIAAASKLVHIHTAWTYPGLAAMRACRKVGVPFVVMPHGMFDGSSLRRKWVKKQLYGRFVEWPNVRAAAAMVYTHEEERRLAENSVSRLPAGFVVPLGSDPPPVLSRQDLATQFIERYPQFRDRRIVLFLSRLHPKKGLDLLIPAFRSVASRIRDSQLVIAGAGDDAYLSSLRRLVGKEGLVDRITFTGPLYGNVKWEAFAAASMFVLPSYQENFALVVVEAMRMALPIVLSRRVNIWSDIVGGGAGVPCDLSADSVAATICRLLADPDLAGQIGLRGKQLATDRYTWNQTAAALESVYTSVLAISNQTKCGRSFQ
jgi:glycosyltransferase involved in cell wall biosynthesis